jgi:cytochrome P450
MLTWALYELTQNPEYMARIVKEADGAGVKTAAHVIQV